MVKYEHSNYIKFIKKTEKASNQDNPLKQVTFKTITFKNKSQRTRYVNQHE